MLKLRVRTAQSHLLKSLFVMPIISGMLSACAVSIAAENSDLDTINSQTVDQQSMPIDWERANADASNNSGVRPKTPQTNITTIEIPVPLLLPPNAIVLSDTSPASQVLSPAKMITDSRGYSAVIEGETFTILIDASNRTFVTGDIKAVAQNFFDGEYQKTTSGGQVTIGRYGALYAIQLLCKGDANKQCITERMIREVIESLSVQPTAPR